MTAAVHRAQARDARRRIDQRGEAEFILAMAPHLADRDRVLIEYLYRDGHSAADYARLVRRNARAVQKRVNALLDRIYSREFAFLLVCPDALAPEHRATARRLFVEGRGLRETARLTRRSLHTVRQHRLEIAALLRARLAETPSRPPATHAAPSPESAPEPEFNRC